MAVAAWRRSTFIECFADLFCDDGQARVDLGLIASIVDTDTLLAMAPVSAQTREKLLTRDDQNTPALEAFVKLL